MHIAHSYSSDSLNMKLVPSKRISEPLDLNTGNNEVVEGHSPCFLIILQQQILKTKALRFRSMTSKALPGQRWG